MEDTRETTTVTESGERATGDQSSENAELIAALEAQMDVSLQLMQRLGFTEQEKADCTAQARRALGIRWGAEK